MLTVAIIGRPNVGKSTLFNRLAHKKMAIVDDRPGVTRDWQEAPGSLYDLKLRIIDTAGLEEVLDDSLPSRMYTQTASALDQADVCLFVTDARDGITVFDKHFANWLRKYDKPVILLSNKCENSEVEIVAMSESYKLGLGQPIPVSAEHGYGMEDLYEKLLEFEQDKTPDPNLMENNDDDVLEAETDLDLDSIEGDEDYDFTAQKRFRHENEKDQPVKIAIVGRPNAGKSSLLNAIIDSPRMITGPEAGITRDSVAVNWIFKDRHIRLVDTAGIRKRTKIQDKLEKTSVNESFRSIRLAQVVILVIDACNPLERQDLAIASHVLREGRSLIIAINKWDLITEKSKFQKWIHTKLESSLPQVKEIPVVFISALNGKNIANLMDKVLEAFTIWDSRISTGPLNRWLKSVTEANPPPLADGKSNKLRFITQIKSKPPTFVLWASKPDDLPESYKKYLMNTLYRDFKLKGTTLRLLVRTSQNPYKK